MNIYNTRLTTLLVVIGTLLVIRSVQSRKTA